MREFIKHEHVNILVSTSVRLAENRKKEHKKKTGV